MTKLECSLCEFDYMKVRKMILENHLSCKEFAEAIHVTTQSISNYSP